MRIDENDVFDYANRSLANAREAVASINFNEEHAVKSATASLNQVARFVELPTYYGLAVWSTVLFLDLRGSTKFALTNGPKTTYITMHVLLPTLAYVLNKSNGLICNFRGDGLFGVYGIDRLGKNPDTLDQPGVKGTIIQSAASAAVAMRQVLDRVINPLLFSNGLPSKLEIGVGIDFGDVVITRIGLESINELTVYGDCVNRAAKLCGGNGKIILSPNAEQLYPRVKGGRRTFKAYPADRFPGVLPDGYELIIPEDEIILD